MTAHTLRNRITIAGSSFTLVAITAACDPNGRADGGADDDGADDGIVTIGDDSSGDDSTGDDSMGDDSTGEDSTDGDTGEGTGADDGGVVWCGESEITVAPSTPQVMLVLDKSHSMVSNRWDHDGDAATASVTRWHSLHEVVSTLGGDLEGTMELGALMFPSVALTDNDAATACEVPDVPDVAVGLENAAAIVAAMPAADSEEIWGGTPTSAAIATAAAELQALTGESPKAIVLVTDGAANCMEGVPENQTFTTYDGNLAPLVADVLADHGIPTYVIGIDIVDETVDVPHVNPYDSLDEVAIAGGAAKGGAESFYNTRDEDELAGALGEITDQLSCQIVLDALPTAAERVHLVVDGNELAYSAECADEGGWRYAADGTAVELCAAACDDFTATGTLNAGFDCLPEP